MPYKSKKNRRITRNPVAGQPAVTQNDSTAASVDQTARPVYSKVSKAQAPAVAIETHFLSELKWIGLVTLIIIILLIVAYYIFR